MERARQGFPENLDARTGYDGDLSIVFLVSIYF